MFLCGKYLICQSISYRYSGMQFSVQKQLRFFSHLFYPHNCEGCGTDMIGDDYFLCAKCMHALPVTGFFAKPGNPVEKLFYGRVPVTNAGASFYFTKDSLLQHLLIQLKYKGNKESGFFLGRAMGYALQQSARFSDIDLLVPLPLHPKKKHTRGYNQAALICEGISEVWHKPFAPDALTRTHFTSTQTRQNRVSRLRNMENVFGVLDADLIKDKHVLLIDDVITTGATLESCTAAMLAVEGVKVSIGAAGYTV